MQLYNYFRSSTSYRIRIALNIKGLAYEYKPVHLLNNGGEQHSTEFRTLNPLGEVPTLMVNGKPISQSMAILEYLEEMHPQQKLLPADPVARANVRQFCEAINCGIHPLQNLKTMKYLSSQLNVSEDEKQKWISHWVSLAFTALETQTKQSSGEYCFGNEITAADLFLVPQIFSAERFNVAMSDFPTLKRIEQRCSQHEAFFKAHPYRQPDTPAELRI